MLPYERYFTGPKIPTVNAFTNKVLGLKVFKKPRKVKCKFYIHYNPCRYTGQKSSNFFSLPEVKISSKIKSKVIKIGWIHSNSPNQVLWYFNIIKTRKPINVIGISMYLKEYLVARTVIEPTCVRHKDELWLTYTLNKCEL